MGRLFRLAVGWILVAFVAPVLAWPGLVVVSCLFDPGLSSNRVPRVVWGWHRALAPRYAAWARERVAKGAAVKLGLDDISGTEWPAYGSVFFLRATEQLQDAWDRGERSGSQPPREYAREAVNAAAALVVDPGNAAWVMKHWGTNYLHTENVFYRMLVIDALAAHARLVPSSEHLPLLREQSDSLARELDASPLGLLDDYPGQCYPVDIISAWGAIQRADAVLGTDHGLEIQRGLRAFTGRLGTAEGLPPFQTDKQGPRGPIVARGCGVLPSLFQAARLWPEQARTWYALAEEHLWQSGSVLTGFREFPRGRGPQSDFYVEVDAGPVVAGLGTAASAFGVAACRAHGRFDRARPLALEMIACSWPLPTGRLWLPEGVSDVSDAPHIGSAAILFTLSHPMAPGFVATPGGGGVPGLVWGLLAFYLGGGALALWGGWALLRR